MSKNPKANILIVDDKPGNIFALEQILAKPNRNLVRAMSGKEALKILLNKHIDLIILDVQMPEMNGFEVAQIIKSNKRTKDIPIIFASAERKEHQWVMQGFGEGAVDYLYKPLDPDITEAKVSVLLQLQMQRNELIEKNTILEKYALLINNSTDLICIIDPSSLKFIEVNDTVFPMLGYTPQEFKGSQFPFYLNEEDRVLVKKLSSEAGEQISFETRIYRKNRAVKWLFWNIVHKNRLWFANARDITEIKEVEETKSYLAAVVKQSNEAIYLHNPEGRIISWNQGAEEIYGFTETEALKMNIWNIVPEYLMKETQKAIANLTAGKPLQSIETKRITKYGHMVDVMFSASIITDAKGILKSIAITERNITEQKKNQQEIRQLNINLNKNIEQLEITNKELESFSYSVSHDLRAPLRAINGFAGIIVSDFGDRFDEESKNLFGIIQKNASKMGELIDDLLKFSRLGRNELVKVNVDLNGIVSNILNNWTGPDKSHAHIQASPLTPTEGDPSLLSQVFSNLLYNAVKYSAKNPEARIEIGEKSNPNETTYFVKDNGVGFNMTYSDKLFGVFQRLHNADDFEGTGVGLAIVKRIVVRHGGKVWAEGEVNKGATFYFSLPKGGE
jgi:PAS domain S-box-containing protein